MLISLTITIESSNSAPRTQSTTLQSWSRCSGRVGWSALMIPLYGCIIYHSNTTLNPDVPFIFYCRVNMLPRCVLCIQKVDHGIFTILDYLTCLSLVQISPTSITFCIQLHSGLFFLFGFRRSFFFPLQPVLPRGVLMVRLFRTVYAYRTYGSKKGGMA